MRYPMGKKYCNSIDDLHQFRFSIKWFCCPRCGKTGFLIGHGFLRGYSASGQGRVMRGFRFFCSNRFRKTGCGRTFSVLLSEFILGFMITAPILWSFVQGLEKGLCASAAWCSMAGGFTTNSGYRILRLITNSQSRLKSFLCRVRPPPACDSENPLLQLAAHFRTVFPASSCPFASFQEFFQESLLR
jgi:hypothetical protein